MNKWQPYREPVRITILRTGMIALVVDRPAWWLGELAFIGIELMAHLLLLLRGRPAFYNGRG